MEIDKLTSTIMRNTFEMLVASLTSLLAETKRRVRLATNISQAFDCQP